MSSYWGPHFPPLAAYWDGHFPDGQQDPNYFSGFGPPGSFTFALDINAGFQVTYTWVTDIIKRYSGTEQRIAVNDAPKQFYKGSAVLLNNEPRRILSKLARFIHIGSTFLLGLPHEGMSLVEDADGNSVFVNQTQIALCDWMHYGQRVVVIDAEGNSVGAVIQATPGSGEIQLDVAPGSIGRYGGNIMPAMAIYLDPEQGFVRHPANAEEWQLSGRAAIFDFAPTAASLALGPLTSNADLEGAIVYSRVYGYQGNQVQYAMDSDAAHPATGELVEVIFGTPLTLFRFKPGVTTIGNLRDALIYSTNAKLGGTYDPDAVMEAGDEMGQNLENAVAAGDFGLGATLTTYDDRPVWDRPIQVDPTAGDSLQALTEILDMDGLPYAIGSADFADWGRHVMIRRTIRSEWQWFKKFMSTVRGRQKGWWLPSYRNDLAWISHTGTSLVIDSAEGDLFTWWPEQRSHIQIRQDDGTITRTNITDAVDNGDGTITLTLDESLSVTDVDYISWLELCRFENDEFTVEFKNAQFSFTGVARVVRE